MIELKGKYTDAKIFASTIEEGVYQQVYDIINCKAFEGQKVILAPDCHVGASGPCGLVATLGNYVCPEHIGVDIGCTVSAMILDKCVPEDKYAEFEHRIKKYIPFGFDINKTVVIDEKEFRKFMTNGCNKYKSMWPEMMTYLPNTVTEEYISQLLKKIGMDEGTFYKSLGSVGGGNHFCEYDESDDKSVAAVLVHCGSRNFGLKVCKYWTSVAKSMSGGLTKAEVRDLTKIYKKSYLISHKDMTHFKEDLNAYIEEKRNSSGHINGYLHGHEMKGYMADMAFAQLYAQYNHITIRKKIAEILSSYGIKPVDTITSVHNFIDIEDHVMRKSAIRSYAGETMLVPFNMRDGVAVCEGLSNPDWLNSCAHGAGRKMSRSAAKKNITLDAFKASMEGIYSTTVNTSTIDEAPMAYKDTDEIKELIKQTCKIKYMLKPRINIKAAE